MKKALVTGTGGFIGWHLVNKLKEKGYWVRGVDVKFPQFSPTFADEFLLLDLREEKNCQQALTLEAGNFDEVYNLAADMGGLGFIHSAEAQILHNNVLINTHMIHNSVMLGIPRYFFSSSVCVYRDMQPGEPAMCESEAIPANPNNEYGWEKLYSEITALTYARKSDTSVRIARFQNCYGPEGEWVGGREKAPAAICRKIAEAEDGGTIDIWGDGTAIRSYTYIGDMIEGIFLLTQSNLEGPVNIGCPQYVSVNELVEIVAEVAQKKVQINHIDGPVGVHSRNFSNDRISSIGWKSRYSLRDGISLTYPWIKVQLDNRSLEI